MADPTNSKSQVCILIYDGQCRLCVTAKKGLERLGSHSDATPIRMIPYQSEEANHALGEGYEPGCPNVAFLVYPNGAIASGLDAFLALLPGLKGGRVLSAILRVPLIKPFGYLLYRLVARYRYLVFGKVPLAAASESPEKPSRQTPHS